MNNLQSQFNTAFLSLGGTLENAQISKSNLADYQVNGALALAKKNKTNPKILAQEIISKINAEGITLEVAGPGFINIKLSDKSLLENLQIKTELKENVLIDYSSPNVAKAMHVGHLRSTIIGSALYHMYKKAGANIVGDNHLGDWGTPMGIVLTKIQEQENFSWDLKNIEQIYVEGSKEYKSDESFKQKVQTNTHLLQQKKEPLFSLWKKLVETTKSSLHQDYKELNVTFDLWEGESSFDETMNEMMIELKEKNLVQESNGATIFPLNEEVPLVLEKGAGGYLYATTDLACLKKRSAYDKILYVVDKRQSLHFNQVFSAAKVAGYSDKGVHVSFGTINGADGKPFKTRSGEVLKLSELILEAKQKAFEKLKELNPNLPQEKNLQISSLVGVGALKFAELKHNRDTDYSFDLDKFVSLEGFTGPYVMYQVLRSKSILDKTSEVGVLDLNSTLSVEERKLAFLMSKTSAVMSDALSSYMPHYLCEHLYELCQAFSAFYTVTPVLKENDEKKRKHYLALVENFKNQGFYLFESLNIELPKEM